MLNQEEISNEAFGLWKSLPITQELFRQLREEKQNFIDMLSTGVTLKGHSGETAEATAEAVGVVKGIDFILNADFEDAKPEEETEEAP